MVSDHLSSGNFQDISEESNRIPKTVPKVVCHEMGKAGLIRLLIFCTHFCMWMKMIPQNSSTLVPPSERRQVDGG